MAVLPSTFGLEKTRGLQMALNEKTGSNLTIDGAFGNASIAALKAYQAKVGIPVTGVYDAATDLKLGKFLADKYLDVSDFILAAADLRCSVAAIRAIAEVESPRGSFIPDGRCSILFERHKFYGYLATKRSASEMERLCVQYQDIVSKAAGGYKNSGAGEYERFNRALALDADAAMMSTSWGMFQIMGFNYQSSGFSSVGAFVASMQISERNQLKALVSHIKANANLLSAIRTESWATFAKGYNGSNYAINNYDVKIAAAFKKYSNATMLPPVVAVVKPA